MFIIISVVESFTGEEFREEFLDDDDDEEVVVVAIMVACCCTTSCRRLKGCFTISSAVSWTIRGRLPWSSPEISRNGEQSERCYDGSDMWAK
jgi:hypothetical protein